MAAASSPVTVPRKRRTAPRTTTGCLCCRLRRKKCDETKPECLGCIRNGLICSFASVPVNDEPDNKVDSPEQASRRGISGNREQPFQVHRALGTPWLQKPASRLLFDHYRGKTAGKLGGITGPDNPFIACILPLAIADSLVMHGVLALSGAHMINGNKSVDVTSSTWIHYGLAVRGLKHELTKKVVTNQADTARLLVTTLLLSHVEVCCIDSYLIDMHLKKHQDHRRKFPWGCFPSSSCQSTLCSLAFQRGVSAEQRKLARLSPRTLRLSCIGWEHHSQLRVRSTGHPFRFIYVFAQLFGRIKLYVPSLPACHKTYRKMLCQYSAIQIMCGC